MIRALELKSENPGGGGDVVVVVVVVVVGGGGGGGGVIKSNNGFLSLRVNSCADLFVSESPSCVLTIVRTLNIPYPSVVKD